MALAASWKPIIENAGIKAERHQRYLKLLADNEVEPTFQHNGLNHDLLSSIGIQVGNDRRLILRAAVSHYCDFISSYET